MTYFYVIGHDPYNNSEPWRWKGNGTWAVKADCMQSALEQIFGSMPFPTELTGRSSSPFVEGVMLPLPEDEVIQVWSNEPAATANRSKMLAAGWEHLPHWGDHTLETGGLLCEIPVADVEKYLRSDKKLLTGPSSDPSVAVSPVGATVNEFQTLKHDIMLNITGQKWDIVIKKQEMEETQLQLRNQVAEMEEKINLANIYTHGIRSKIQLFKGERGSGPYHVFQQRQFLNREVGLLANMVEFDCRNMEQLDEWLVKEGKLFKMLPFERTILVTRIRDVDKEYGDAFTNWAMSAENMVSVIWIRDGKNVWRVNVDIDFDNCVFPDGDEAKRIIQYVNEVVFDKIYSVNRNDHFSAFRSSDAVEEVEGELRVDAMESETPYTIRTKFPARFKTIEDWMNSEDYTTDVGVKIGQACNDYIARSNKRKMKFALLLQGIVDTTDFLDIPKGTNLFDCNEVCKYITLVNDYTHALPDGHARDIIASATDRTQLRVGQIVIVDSERFEEDARESYYHCASLYKMNRWRFYKITVANGGAIKVNHHFCSKRGFRTPVKKAAQATVQADQAMIRADLTQEVVNMLLNDREWKLANRDIVPVLSQWSHVSEQYSKAVNFTPVSLKSPTGGNYE